MHHPISIVLQLQQGYCHFSVVICCGWLYFFRLLEMPLNNYLCTCTQRQTNLLFFFSFPPAVSAAINVSIEAQKQEWMALLYHALHGSRMPKVKCNQWVSVFHSSLWLRHKQRVNPSLLSTGSLPVSKAKCQKEGGTRARESEREMMMRSEVESSSMWASTLCLNTVVKSSAESLNLEFHHIYT